MKIGDTVTVIKDFGAFSIGDYGVIIQEILTGMFKIKFKECLVYGPGTECAVLSKYLKLYNPIRGHPLTNVFKDLKDVVDKVE